MNWRQLLTTLQVPLTPLILAMALTVLMTLSALGLLALSGWFLTAAALAGLAAVTGAYAFNILQPSSMIRLLAVSRTLTRYVERLLSHDATLRLVVKLRRFVFDGLLGSIGQQRISNEDALNRLIQDASVVEGALLRTVLPWLGALIAAAFTPLLALVIAPEAIWPGLIPLLTFLGLTRLRQGRYQALADAIDAESRRTRARAIALADGRHELQLALSDSALDALTESAYGPLAALKTARVHLERTDRIILALGHALAFAWLALLPLELPILVALLLGLLATGELMIPGITVSFESRRVVLALSRLPRPTTEAPTIATSAQLVLESLEVSPEPHTPPVACPITLTLSPGDHLRLEGPSGIGKTTVLRTLAGLLVPVGGRMSRPASCGLVEQAPWLPSDQLRQALTLGLPKAPQDDAIVEALALVELREWVEQLEAGLDTWIGVDGIQPSGGQWRRLAIARLVLQDPELVLLDEPTEGLEPALGARLIERLLHRFKDRIVVVVSHRSDADPMLQSRLLLQAHSTQDSGVKPVMAASI